MAQLGRRYLVHVRIGKGTPALNRIKIAAEGVQRVLESLTIGKGNCQLAYTSHDGASFGFLIKTTRYASAIRAQLESPGTTFDKPFAEPTPRIPPPLLGEDSILVVEVGEDFNCYGFTRATAWLEHH